MNKIYTSIYISMKRRLKFEECARRLGVDEVMLFSALCYKAEKHVYKDALSFQTVDYQERGDCYSVKSVFFYPSDHEFLASGRLACKASASLILARAIDLFLDEIMKHGITPVELAYLRKKQNSYQKKTYSFNNVTLKITKNDQFSEYIMKMRMKKT